MTQEMPHQPITEHIDLQDKTPVYTPEFQLAFHETMEIHELLNFETVALVKSKMMSGVVFDQDLKALLEKDVRQSMTAVKQLQGLYQAGPQLT